RNEEAKRLLKLRAPDCEYGAKEDAAVSNKRLGVATAQEFPGRCVLASLPSSMEWDLTLRWSVGLLVRQPGAREDAGRRWLLWRQIDRIIGNFARDPKNWRFDQIWTTVEPSFI